MRAALLPTPGDPFMVRYWLRNFETWRDQVDELVVFVNGQQDPKALAEVVRAVEEAGGRVLTTSASTGHDGAIWSLLNLTSADYVVLCEDDAYVRRPAAIGRAFHRIERGFVDIIGSPRHEDYAGQFVTFGAYEPGSLDELRKGLWPTFLFAKRADLLATDQVFGDQRWDVGEMVEGWGVVTPAAAAFVGIDKSYIHLDTFFGTTFQLRAAGLRTDLIHHVRLFDVIAAESWLPEDPPWFHITGLSTLSDVLGGGPLPDMSETGGLWTRRMAWWMTTTTGPGAQDRLDVLTDACKRLNIVDRDLWAWVDRLEAWVTWTEVAA